jgi:riboflavin synthase
MFTGLVQGMGRVEAVSARGREIRLTVRAEFLGAVVQGESIAVNGACLTAEAPASGRFSAYASAETLSKTSLGGLKPGAAVNLERALALGDRLGGHLVSGHVDCLAEVVSVTPAGESKTFRLRFPREFGSQVVPKGSVALDGVSLTVNECGEDFLSVNIIPATQRETTIGQWTPGRAVNMETDLIGKYVLRMLGPWAEKAGIAAPGLSAEFLRRNGF